jgi:hypothetical protein
MTPSAWVLALTAIVAGGLCIVQLWVPQFSTEVFIKILITLGVIATVTGLVAIARREGLSRKRDYID